MSFFGSIGVLNGSKLIDIRMERICARNNVFGNFLRLPVAKIKFHSLFALIFLTFSPLDVIQIKVQSLKPKYVVISKDSCAFSNYSMKTVN